jgi:uncharacterized linocin/CFP29 family protein
VRKVLPLIEVRVPATLKQMQIDNISRGSKTPDLAALEEAARKVARFEEQAIYFGFPEGGMEGMIDSSAHDPMALPAKPEQLVSSVAQGVKKLRLAGVGGPFALVLSGKVYQNLMVGVHGGYPIKRVLQTLLQDGDVLWSPVIEGGVLLSTRGGDFELTVGQDLSIGYARHDTEEVELYITESMRFRVLQPEAVIQLHGKQ